jgi:hypothetical protein
MTILKSNYAKMIYKLVGADWSDDPNLADKIPIRRIKKSIAKADDFEKEILALLYGAVGVMTTKGTAEEQG